MSRQERIAHLLLQGFTPSQVAGIVGCTPAYISQLKKDEEFIKTFTEMQKPEREAGTAGSEEEEQSQRLYNKYLATEHALLDSIAQSLPLAEFRDKVGALNVVAQRQMRMQQLEAMKKLPQAPGAMNVGQVTVVQLNMPQQALPSYVVNGSNEIVAINEKSLAPMSSLAVEQMFKERKALKEISYHESARSPGEGPRSIAEIVAAKASTVMGA